MANPARMKTIHTTRDREKRKRLIILVHILRQYLQKHNMSQLYKEVQIIVRDCHSRHLRRDPSARPLTDVIETRLQLLINRNIWTQVILCLELYMAFRHNRTQDVLHKAILTETTNGTSSSNLVLATKTAGTPSTSTGTGHVQKKNSVSV